MLGQQKNQPVVYDANGVPFTIYKTTKPTKSGPKVYWVLEERLTTGRRRLLNNKSLKAAKERADKLRAAHIKGQAARMSLTAVAGRNSKQVFSEGRRRDALSADTIDELNRRHCGRGCLQ